MALRRQHPNLFEYLSVGREKVNHVCEFFFKKNSRVLALNPALSK